MLTSLREAVYSIERPSGGLASGIGFPTARSQPALLRSLGTVRDEKRPDAFAMPTALDRFVTPVIVRRQILNQEATGIGS